MKSMFSWALFATHFISTAVAGTLSDSNWVPSEACGEKPVVPVLKGSNIESYNKSVLAINEWQKKANTYYECLVKEANADNSLIAETVNREQQAYRQAVEQIAEKVTTAKKKLEN